MDYAKRGAAALESFDAVAAINFYTKALIEHPLSPDYFTQRSVAFARLKPPRHDLALRDSETAVILSQRRAKREKIQAAQHRRVVSLYGLGRYADAKYVLDTMQRWRSKDVKKDIMEGQMWKARIELKLKTLPESEQVASIKEYPDIQIPDVEELRANLETQLGPDGLYRFDGQEDNPTADQDTHSHDKLMIESAPQPPEPSNTSVPASTTGATPVSSTAMPVDTKLRHEWYQSSDSVTITLYVKGVSKDTFQVDMEEDSIYISFPNPTNPTSDFTFSLDPLFAGINVTSSKWTVMSTKVEVILKKSTSGQKWPSLEGIQPSTAATDGSNTSTKTSTLQEAPKSTKMSSRGPSYPTSAKSGPKDWDKVAKDLMTKKKTKEKEKKKKEKEKKKKEKKEKKDKAKGQDSDDESTDDESTDAESIDSDFGIDTTDAFFKKLYAGADDDTKRAMVKSLQESNGTTLSTNWAEVGKGKVEPYEYKEDNGMQ